MYVVNLNRPINIYTFELWLPSENPPRTEPIAASSRDYGFDFDEDELGRELLAPVIGSALDQPNPTVQAEEFDLLYRWINS